MGGVKRFVVRCARARLHTSHPEPTCTCAKEMMIQNEAFAFIRSKALNSLQSLVWGGTHFITHTHCSSQNKTNPAPLQFFIPQQTSTFISHHLTHCNNTLTPQTL
jgi:hypothetical protein